MTGDPSYLAAIDASPPADREFAVALAGEVITLIKAFGAVRNRVSGSGDNIDIAVLGKLVHSGPIRVVDLADQLCHDQSTVSRQVASLVKAGLIERQADPDDGRASLLVTTEAGQERFRRIAELRGQLFAPLVADWTPAERDSFLHLLSRFGGAVTDNLEDIKTAAAHLMGTGATARRSA